MKNTQNQIVIYFLLFLLVATNIWADDKWLISSGMAGDIKIGTSVDKLKIHSSMKLKKSIKTMKTEEGVSEEPIYILSGNKGTQLEIYLEYDYKQSKYNNKVGELSVISDKYQTSKGIRIGSTVKDFTKRTGKALFGTPMFQTDM